MDFSGQKALITGATRGIGRAIAEAFLAAGATVIGTYGANEQDAREFNEAGDWGEHLQLHRCDVADHLAVEKLYQQIEEQYDAIDIMVSNAGIRRDAVTAMMKQEDWQRVIDVNLTGTFNMAKQAVLLMLKKKYGRIIFITSPMAHLGFAGQANYSASKAGQIGMMRSLSKETAKRKITVNCVSPGFIDTELLDDLNDDQLKEYKKVVPMRRFGKPSEVADAVLFLASDKAAYITGSVLDVNGGL
jgi:3-oxoacyl-[acyl-carrier protein] reductase